MNYKDKIIPHPEYFKRIHICSQCKNQFEWDEFCEWFGTIENVIYKTCSKQCKRLLQENEPELFKN